MDKKGKDDSNDEEVTEEMMDTIWANVAGSMKTRWIVRLVFQISGNTASCHVVLVISWT